MWDKSVATSVERRSWGIVKKDLKTDRDRAKTARARQRAIGRELRRMFEDIVEEPVPDDFARLLEDMDRKDQGSEGGNS